MSESVRQQEIIAMAAGPHAVPQAIPYTAAEHEVWALVNSALEPMWEEHVAEEILAARDKLSLPKTTIPQLTDVSQLLEPLSGFEFRSVGGLAPIDEFFGALAGKRFLSTQYIRDPETPFYTEQPDIIHELVGHATLLADPAFAELHSLVGKAITRVENTESKQFIANVWWFSGEFGLVKQAATVKAVGAGLLSSRSELQGFSAAALKQLDIAAMGQTEYRTDQIQPTLFVADSVEHFVNEVGSFFDRVDDGMVANLQKGGSNA